jgi:hypothetical protein
VITLTTKSSCALVARLNENRRSGSSGSNCVNEQLQYKITKQEKVSRSKKSKETTTPSILHLSIIIAIREWIQ